MQAADGTATADDGSASAAPPARAPGAGARSDRGAIDGRHRRSQRSQAAIAQAMLDLLREGASPSSAEIAERAGVTQRTLFNQFGDMDSLVRRVVELQAERVVPLLPEAGQGSAGERLGRFTDQLAALLEDTMHVRWAMVCAASPSEDSTDLRQGVRAFQALIRERAEAGFAVELEALDEGRRALALDAIDAVADPAAWRLRRVHHGRTEREARATLAFQLATALSIDAPTG